MDPKRLANERRLKLGIGLLGAAQAFWFAFLYWRVMNQLNLPARALSLLEHGDKRVFDCREVRAQCSLFDGAPPAWATRGTCSIHAVMEAAERAMRAELQKHSLADLAARVFSKAPTSYKHQVMNWFTDRAPNRRSDRL